MSKITIPLYNECRRRLPCAENCRDIVKIVNGKEFRYTQYLPTGLREGLPLVVEVHGGGGNGTKQSAGTAWAELAERENFVVIYPSANTHMEDRGTKNWRCQTPDYNLDADYIMEIIELVCEEFKIDTTRIYVSGMSFGDMMSTIFAAKYAGRIAGLCSFNGPTTPEEWEKKIRLSAQLPVIQIRGELDATIPRPDCKPPEEEALAWKSSYYVWNRERWLENNNANPVPQIVLTDKKCFALYEADPCDLRYVEYKAMGHVEPLDGMELAWEHCFSRYRRTENGIERLCPADDWKSKDTDFAIAVGSRKVYTAGGIKEMAKTPVMGEPAPLPEDHWCTVCKDDFGRQSVVYAALSVLAELLGGTEHHGVVTLGEETVTFYQDSCFAASDRKHFAMEQIALELDGELWVPAAEALRVMGMYGAEKDGVVYCTSSCGYLTKGFATLLKRLLQE